MRGPSSYEMTISGRGVGVWSVCRGIWRMRLEFCDMIEERGCVLFVCVCVLIVCV